MTLNKMQKEIKLIVIIYIKRYQITDINITKRIKKKKKKIIKKQKK